MTRGQVVRLVHQTLRKEVEPKFFDSAFAYSQVDRGGWINTLTLVPQGVQQSNRVGDELQARKLLFRMNAYLNQAVGLDNTHALRLMIVRWNVDSSIGVPTIGSLFSTTGSVLITASHYEWNAFRQKDFAVLFDKTWSVGAYNGVELNLSLDLGDRKIVFDPASTAGAGHIYAVLVADDLTGAHTPSISAQYVSRLIFSDD